MSTSRAPKRQLHRPRLSADAEMVIDQHGSIAGWSDEAHELLGFTRDEILGR
ncbi:PAS domain S-box protein [Streptomyces sp. NBC_00467]|uniref:PAS domain S-box protein n=1 Tax=Streptomyces sp. NBC_00467 TaxID=2975752 RepID=UPI002E17F97F